MKASVVIPTYNKAAYLEFTLESLFHQSYDKDQYEVIIVNDGARDNTSAIIDQFAQRDWSFHAIEQPNLGRGVARNTGIQAASGDIVIFVEDDCICTQNLVAEHVLCHGEANKKVILGLRREVYTRIPINQVSSMDVFRTIVHKMDSSITGSTPPRSDLYREAIEKMFTALPATVDIVTAADVVNDLEKINRLSVQVFNAPQDLLAIAESRNPCPWIFLSQHMPQQIENFCSKQVYLMKISRDGGRRYRTWLSAFSS